MKIVVTGGAGFIGANLCRDLVAKGINEIVALDDLSTGFRSNLDGVNVEFVEGSILDRALLNSVVRDAHSVVHLAARPSVPRSVVDPVASHEANATGTLYVLEAAREHGAHVCLASSSSVYGRNPTLPKSEDLNTMPMSPYAVSKLAAETYALAYAHCYDMKTLPFRFFNVFGPLQAAGHAYAAVVPAFVSNALRGEPVVVHGDGEQTRDFTYVGTVTEVLSRAAIDRVTSETPVNLAFGNRTSLLELIDLLSDVLGRTVETEHVGTRAGDVRDSQADNSRLRALFPETKPVSLRTGLEATVQWMSGLVPIKAS